MIPMVFERTITDPDQLLGLINNERIAAGEEPISSLFEEDANKSIKSVIWSESRYPHLMRAINNIYRMKKGLSPQGQEWVERWLRHQVLGRPTSVDQQMNTMMGPFNSLVNQLNKVLPKTLKVRLGYNPTMAVSRGIISRAIHAGGILGNLPLAAVNFTQVGHNLALVGPVAFAKAERALLNPKWDEGRQLLKHSRIFQRRYPYENLDFLKQNVIEAIGRGPYRLMDLHNITNGFLSQVYRLYLNEPTFRTKVAPFMKPALKGDRQIWNAILDAAQRRAIDDELYVADYFTYMAQYPYQRIGMQAVVQSGLGAAAETFQTWWQNYFTSYMPELLGRTFTGRTSLGTKVSPAERLGGLWFAMWIAGILTTSMAAGKPAFETMKRIMPHRVFGRIKSPQVQIIESLFDAYSGFTTGDNRKLGEALSKLKSAAWLGVPGGVAIRRAIKGRTLEERFWGKKQKGTTRLQRLKGFKSLK